MAKHRSSEEGCIRKRADGRWEGRHVTDHDPNGKAIRCLSFAQRRMPEIKPFFTEFQAQVAVYSDVSIVAYQPVGLRVGRDYSPPIFPPEM